MIINEDLLIAFGGEYETYPANTVIFSEGSQPKFYFQIVNGNVELNNYHEDGKEFTQNILSDGQSFGESLLFNDQPYPMNAIATTECRILKLSKSDFLDLISQNKKVSFDMFKCLSDRLYYKYLMLFSITSSNPAYKIRALMDYIKGYNSSAIPKHSFLVPFTRRQIANLTGLRIETVIRTIKKMENEKILKIENRKIYY